MCMDPLTASVEPEIDAGISTRSDVAAGMCGLPRDKVEVGVCWKTGIGSKLVVKPCT
jgi:hypothetical protein